MAASIYFQSGQVVLDNNGRVAPGAKLFFYDGNTSTPRDTFSNAALSSLRTHPVLADGNGRIPIIYLNYGSFDVKCATSGGTQLFYHTNIANPEPFDDTTSFDTTTTLGTGEIFSRLVNGTRTGAVRLNGRTIGNASSSATERADPDTSDLFAHLWNNLADAQAAVSGGRGSSAAQDFAANKRITLPDWRGVGPVGFADMGNTASALLDSAPVITGSTIVPGSILGANTHTLISAQLPATTPAGTISQITPAGTISQITPAGTVSTPTITGTAAAQTFTGTNATITATGTNSTSALTGGVTAAISRFPTGAGGGANDFLTTAATGSTTTYGVTGTAAAQTFTGTGVSYTPAGTNASSAITASSSTPTFTGTPTTPTFTGTPTTPTFTGASFGSGTAHNNLARSGLVTWFIKL